MPRLTAQTTRFRWQWWAVIALLLALRAPSLVQPAGGDQGLYGYAGHRILAGDVMYRDVWDQKPPAIAFQYGILGQIWPGDGIASASDLAAAAAVVWLLVILGRQNFSADVGYAAAAIFLLFGDPYLQRLSGIYVRGQCEPFVALAITAGLTLLTRPHRARAHLIGAGVALGWAFWLKYNAGAYVLPLVVATWASGRRDTPFRPLVAELAWIAAGFAIVGTLVVAYFAANGALTDLRLATIDYNLRYSNETYEGRFTVLRYLLTFPLERARIDGLWFLGALGALLVVPQGRSNRSVLVVLAWLAAAAVSIAVNGSRSLPNYFVQANPALALAASAGLFAVLSYPIFVRYGVIALVLAGTWRVGADRPVWGLRLWTLPGLVENVRYDLSYLRGHVDRDTYLRRFRGQKHDALENEQLVRDIVATTSPADRIFVFGFSGGSVSWKSERQSASRFFWSRPVLIEFASDVPGYGSAGLLADLRRNPPAVVALQNEEWRSREFFMSNAGLRTWLEAGYRIDRETPMFTVWRRQP